MNAIKPVGCVYLKRRILKEFMFTFNIDEYIVTVLRTMDQYNDYSVAFDVTVHIQDLDRSWTQLIVAKGDDEASIKAAFREYNENGWIRPE